PRPKAARAANRRVGVTSLPTGLTLTGGGGLLPPPQAVTIDAAVIA
ncbi:MAG: hypothetical protein HC843_13450, partial [Sphingomonadales bacterium]|nr:hypothetical protein [Sphingomonadales bacterium]